MRPFAQVDVFADDAVALSGNPVAVVLDAEGLTDDDMQAFARWTALSETTFVLPPTTPQADYRVRIFTPSRELPFAGHPTLGTAHTVAADADALTQECAAGLIPVRRIDGRLAFAAPPLLRGGVPTAAERAAAVAAVGLGEADVIAGEWVDNGPGWIGLLVSAEALERAHPTGADLDVGLVALDGDGLRLRAIYGHDEDPVTGSLNASVAQWLLREGRVHAPYVARQTTGVVHVSADDDGQVWVAGTTRSVVEGRAHVV